MDVFWVNVLDVLKTCPEDVFGTGVCPLDDSVMEAVQNGDKLSPKGRGTVYQPVVLDRLSRLHESPEGHI